MNDDEIEKIKKGMKHTEVDGFPTMVDLNDPDGTEVELLDWAHTVSMKGPDDSTRCVGRALKLFVPAFCQFLRDERHRKDSTKSDMLNGVINSSGVILALLMSGCVREEGVDQAINQALVGLDCCIRSRVQESVTNRHKQRNDNGAANEFLDFLDAWVKQEK